MQTAKIYRRNPNRPADQLDETQELIAMLTEALAGVRYAQVYCERANVLPPDDNEAQHIVNVSEFRRGVRVEAWLGTRRVKVTIYGSPKVLMNALSGLEAWAFMPKPLTA